MAKKTSRKGKTYEELYGVEKARIIRKKLSESHKGQVFTEEAKIKRNETVKRRKAKGLINPGMAGKKQTKEWRKNHSKLMKGRKITWAHKISAAHQKYKTWEEKYGKEKAAELRETKIKANQGKTHSEETKKKMSEAHKGEKAYWYGKNLPEETRRKLSEKNRGTNMGEDNPAWVGGVSFEPYTPDFNVVFKRKIRERDNYCCVVCNEHEEISGRRLSVHHIDYNKKNSFPQNCVSLCNLCHVKTNMNRAHWKKFFQSLLAERCGYEYTLDQKMIIDFEGDVIGE